MKDPDNKIIYVEDGFELEDLKRRTLGQKLKSAKILSYKKAVKLLHAISVILMLLVAFSAIRTAAYYVQTKRAAVIDEQSRKIASATPEPIIAKQSEEPTALPSLTHDPTPLDSFEEGSWPIIQRNNAARNKIYNLREAFSNDDIVGYLKLEGTNIDYAVAQTSDNDFYLNHNLYGEKNVAGSVFMDFECDARNLSRNTVIYGHNMRDGSMFHNLRYFADPDYFDEHRFISLSTPYGETTWEIFSFYKTDPEFYYIQVNFSDDDSFSELVSEMKLKSQYDMGVDVSLDDKILTLSTCSNTLDNARLVINAKLIPSS